MAWPDEASVYPAQQPVCGLLGELSGSQCNGIKGPGWWLGASGVEPIGRGTATRLTLQT